jgi:hypothetical protein
MKILLEDLDDGRRDSRTTQLRAAGYDVDSRAERDSADCPANPGTYDLMIFSLHLNPEDAASYVDSLRANNPQQPILLLTDYGVFVPKGCLGQAPPCGPLAKEVAGLLTGSTEVKELGGQLPAALSLSTAPTDLA